METSYVKCAIQIGARPPSPRAIHFYLSKIREIPGAGQKWSVKIPTLGKKESVKSRRSGKKRQWNPHPVPGGDGGAPIWTPHYNKSGFFCLFLLFILFIYFLFIYLFIYYYLFFLKKSFFWNSEILKSQISNSWRHGTRWTMNISKKPFERWLLP